MYKIYVKNSPITDFPVFFTTSDEGVSQPLIVKNVYLTVTSVEVEYAYECGYTEIYLVDAVVSTATGKPFKKFIDEHYAQRAHFKA